MSFFFCRFYLSNATLRCNISFIDKSINILLQFGFDSIPDSVQIFRLDIHSPSTRMLTTICFSCILAINHPPTIPMDGINQE
jgi:hypothetical protein